MPILADAILVIIEKRPMISARELAEAIYGGRAYQQLVNGECLYLMNWGKIERAVRPDGIFGYRLAANRQAA
jgi:hypothetical protein